MPKPKLAALWIDGELRAPAVGWWRGGPSNGNVVSPGEQVGELEVLGVLYHLVAPAAASGVVVSEGTRVARVPVGYGDLLARVDPLDSAAGRPRQLPPSEKDDAAGLTLRSPTSGRFYGRPGPDKPPFVQAGDEVQHGTTVCLLEVMKTFSRVVYGGEGLPERARVIAVVPEDESDLATGDVILELEST